MDLVALVDAPEHVCCRYRVEAFRPHLERAGHSLRILPLPRSWWSRLWLFRQLRGASVLLQRRLLSAMERTYLRRQVRHLIFDFDDAVFLRDSYSRKGFHDSRRLSRFRGTVGLCDAIVAGNRFLASATQLPRRTHLIPTCVDEVRYARARHAGMPTGDGKTLVWIGSSSTLQGLEAIAPLLDRLGQRIPGLRLKVICDRFPRFTHLAVLPVPWSASTEVAELCTADVGISWIPDDPWSRGKCGLKVLQYMAAGLPVVANPVGVHPEMIHPGETGYLAESVEDWLHAIERLVGDRQARQAMGEAGRDRFLARYSVEAGARAWQQLLIQLEQPQSEKVPA